MPAYHQYLPRLLTQGPERGESVFDDFLLTGNVAERIGCSTDGVIGTVNDVNVAGIVSARKAPVLKVSLALCTIFKSILPSFHISVSYQLLGYSWT